MFRTVTVTDTASLAVADAGALTEETSTSVTSAGGDEVKPSTVTSNSSSTRSMRLRIVCVELPANSSPTGCRFASFVTTPEPESPPALKPL